MVVADQGVWTGSTRSTTQGAKVRMFFSFVHPLPLLVPKLTSVPPPHPRWGTSLSLQTCVMFQINNAEARVMTITWHEDTHKITVLPLTRLHHAQGSGNNVSTNMFVIALLTSDFGFKGGVNIRFQYNLCCFMGITQTFHTSAVEWSWKSL